MKSPVTLYIVHHPDCELARTLTAKLYNWFRLGYLSGDQSGAGLPVYFRRWMNKNHQLVPQIQFQQAELNVVILLTDELMVADPHWRAAAVDIAKEIQDLQQARPENPETPSTRAILLPVALHESFYRLSPIYEFHNPIRLIGLSAAKSEAVLRRAVTEATANALRIQDGSPVRPLKVFLSHAKKDGAQVAEHIRDSIRKFAQLEAWYDANDLPYGAQWKSPMIEAAQTDTAAMVVTLTDFYPSRPWCRKEVTLARTPLPHQTKTAQIIWKVQPVVAVKRPASTWVRGIPMLEGVPRMGWDEASPLDATERIVDRLVLEVMLGHTHRQTAAHLADMLAEDNYGDLKSCIITWVPDSWTLASLRQQLIEQHTDPLSIHRIVYPGYGLSMAEKEELMPSIRTFSQQTELISYEDVMP